MNAKAKKSKNERKRGSFINGTSPALKDEERVSSISSTKNSEQKNTPASRFGSGMLTPDEGQEDLFWYAFFVLNYWQFLWIDTAVFVRREQRRGRREPGANSENQEQSENCIEE